MKYRVSGYVTFSATAEIEAENEQQAKDKFEGLGTPSLCHQCSDAGEGTEESGEVQLNGADDMRRRKAARRRLSDDVSGHGLCDTVAMEANPL